MSAINGICHMPLNLVHLCECEDFIAWCGTNANPIRASNNWQHFITFDSFNSLFYVNRLNFVWFLRKANHQWRFAFWLPHDNAGEIYEYIDKFDFLKAILRKNSNLTTLTALFIIEYTSSNTFALTWLCRKAMCRFCIKYFPNSKISKINRQAMLDICAKRCGSTLLNSCAYLYSSYCSRLLGVAPQRFA